MTTTPQMIDGRADLFRWVDSIRPNEELTPLDIQKALPPGFAITEDATRGLILHGPFSNSTAVASLEGWGGSARKVKGLTLLQAVARVVECGPRWWSRSLEEQAGWWREQIKMADEFRVEPKDEFATRTDMENHLASCVTCQPANTLLNEAIALGSSRYGDKHLRELIQKSHGDQAGAVRFYESIRDSQRSPYLVTEKPRSQKKGQEVSA